VLSTLDDRRSGYRLVQPRDSIDELVNALQVLVGAVEEWRHTPRSSSLDRDVDKVSDRVMTAVRDVRDSLVAISSSRERAITSDAVRRRHGWFPP
jgi:hypothetical protein